MKAYKDIINFSIIRKLKEKITLICDDFNNLIRPENIKRRESDYYEVYTAQYKQDIDSLINLRNKCQDIVDECNRIMLNMNTYHIKQYYLDKSELSEYEFIDDYNKQEFTNINIPKNISESSPDDLSDDDMW